MRWGRPAHCRRCSCSGCGRGSGDAQEQASPTKRTCSSKTPGTLPMTGRSARASDTLCRYQPDGSLGWRSFASPSAETRPPMPRNTARNGRGTDKRGGYTGGQPGSTVGPPAPIPSGTIKPAPAPNPAQSSKPTS